MATLPDMTLALTESLAPSVSPRVKNAVSLLSTVASETRMVLLVVDAGAPVPDLVTHRP